MTGMLTALAVATPTPSLADMIDTRGAATMRLLPWSRRQRDAALSAPGGTKTHALRSSSPTSSTAGANDDSAIGSIADALSEAEAEKIVLHYAAQSPRQGRRTSGTYAAESRLLF
jgi:hypothetical protein